MVAIGVVFDDGIANESLSIYFELLDAAEFYGQCNKSNPEC